MHMRYFPQTLSWMQKILKWHDKISIFSEQSSNMEQSFAYAQEDISGVMVLKNKTQKNWVQDRSQMLLKLLTLKKLLKL